MYLFACIMRALLSEEKDAVALRRIVDDAIAQGVQLQGLEVGI